MSGIFPTSAKSDNKKYLAKYSMRTLPFGVTSENRLIVQKTVAVRAFKVTWLLSDLSTRVTLVQTNP